jgi:uncharacterized protein with FMN-binding domain
MQSVQFKEKRKDENRKHKLKRKEALEKIKNGAEADFDDSVHVPLHVDCSIKTGRISTS